MPNFLPGFGIFALAGVAAAAGPVIIHLLNRRRFRVIDWAAMDFLMEAVRRNRRILQIRDLLLLLLRTACVALFGFALARPFFSATSRDFDPDRPIHAVLLVDNSLSMNYQKLDDTMLDEAKSKATEFIEDLPEGSRISVIPVCGTPAGYSLDAYRSKEDARDALQKIEAVDRSATAIEAANLALEACKSVPDLSKRVVFLGDQQRINWPTDTMAPQWNQLPEFQVIDMSPEAPENTWISDFRVQDAIADVETQSAFIATLRHEGKDPRIGVQVTLSVDGVDVATKTVDLEPGQTLPVAFKYRFEVATEQGRATSVAAQVSIPEDALPQDDVRHLVVPVVAALPVVFVDQFGEQEEPRKNIYGETHLLRRLLVPVTSRTDTRRQLIQIRHTTIDGLDQELLKDARLVVIAGISSPGAATSLLRQYVLQGGQLIIATGGNFDPLAWNESAWLDGQGILPLPLEAEPIGSTIEEATEDLKPFQLKLDSLMHEYFVLHDVPQAELADLFSEPYFFKAIRADTDDQLLADLQKSEAQRLQSQLRFLFESDARQREWLEDEARGKLDATESDARELDRQEREQYEPTWLTWDNQRENAALGQDGQSDEEIASLAAEVAERTQPRILARFEGGAPYLIERSVGRGNVLFCSSAVFSDWNTLPKTNTILLFDRVMRTMLESTLPRRNFETISQTSLPVRGNERRGRFVLARPDGREEDLFVEALGADSFGVTIRDLSQRGTYTVTAYRSDSADEGDVSAKLWQVPLAINGPIEESQLSTIDQDGLKQRMGEEANYRWVQRDGEISLQGAQVYGQDLWWWLILLVLVLLLFEFVILAWPTVSQEQAA